MRYVFPTSNLKRYRFPTHINDLVVDRADAETSEVFVVVLAPGEAPPLHQHDDTEQIFYVLSGQGVLRIGAGQKKFPVRARDVVRIPPRMLHSIRCRGKRSLRYLAIDCFVGGRPEAEPTWDSHAQVMCVNNRWDYEQVVKTKTRRKNLAAGKKKK